MAYAMTKRGSQDNVITYEFICDTISDMNAIENKYRTLGTIAIVLSGESEGLEVYIAGSNKSWNSLSTVGAADPASAGGLSIYICSQNEVSSGLPNVSEPDESTIYLVGSGNTSGNLYEEYIYVDGAWEKFGAASIDLSNYATKSEIPDVSGFYTKPNGGIPAADLAETYLTQHQDISGLAPKANPEFTGSISMGRKNNTTVGINSVAIGLNNSAAGDYSVAIGSNCSSGAAYGLAVGYCTSSGDQRGQIVFGSCNSKDNRQNKIMIAGNGTASTDAQRSNAYALDTSGNGRYAGDLYVNCNKDSTGGSKVATEAFVTARVPAPPVADGNYILKVNISSGTATYSWVALSDLSGVTF